MTNDVQTGTMQPSMVGMFSAHGKREFLPISRTELERARIAYHRWLTSYNFEPGRYMQISSANDQAAQAIPLERAVPSLGLVPCSAEPGRQEAGRVVSVSQRFDLAAFAATGAEIVERLIELEREEPGLLKGKVIWCGPETCGKVAALPGVEARLWYHVGPAAAMECVEGKGAHVDRLEWQIFEQDGYICLTSRMPRSTDFIAWRSDVKGRVENRPCSCGNPDPRIILAD